VHAAADVNGPLEYEDSGGTGRPVVLLHGLALHAGFWRKVVPLLADAHRCVVPTLPLGGHSRPMPADADLTPPGLATLVADLLEQLDLHDVVLVGNDTGGALAQILVTTRPERVGALVLTPCDAFERFFPWQFKPLQVLGRVPGAPAVAAQALRLPALRRSPLGFGLLTKHGIPDDVSESYVAPLRRNAGVRRDLAAVLRGIRRRYTIEAGNRLHAFDRPALIAWAAEDKVFPVGDARRLAEVLPDARLELVHDSLTYIAEDQPQQLAALIRDFAR
jgi:pimeloyl-ACP methyl ester carboxylesterase